jgi:hypothetical protein
LIEQPALMHRPGLVGPADGDVLGALCGDADTDSEDSGAKHLE